jgi:hypothetical protein
MGPDQVSARRFEAGDLKRVKLYLCTEALCTLLPCCSASGHHARTPSHVPLAGAMAPPRPECCRRAASSASREGGAGPGPSSLAAMRGAAAEPASLLDALDPLLGSGALGLEERRALRQACRAARLAVDAAVRSLDLYKAFDAGLIGPSGVLGLQRFMAQLQGLRDLRSHAAALPPLLALLVEAGGSGVAAGLRTVHLRLGPGGKVRRELAQALHDACPGLEVRG